MTSTKSFQNQTTLIATLGGQPQIVTFTLDLLLRQGAAVDQVVVMYPAPHPRYYNAYRTLMGEFVGDQYAGRRCHLRSVPIRFGDTDTADECTPAQVEQIHATCNELLRSLKEQGHTIHLSLSGGRRMIALMALQAAMVHLSPADRLWHIYTTPELTAQARDGKIMHVPPEGGVRLIPVPFVPWAAWFPGLKPLLELNRREQQEQPQSWLRDEERERCKEVWERLTTRQRMVLRAFADGSTRTQAAGQLHVAVSTIDSHRRVILDHCRASWADEEVTIDTQFLRQRFSPFLRGMDLL